MNASALNMIKFLLFAVHENLTIVKLKIIAEAHYLSRHLFRLIREDFIVWLTCRGRVRVARSAQQTYGRGARVRQFGLSRAAC